MSKPKRYRVRDLSIHEIEHVAEQVKEGLTAECERFVRRGDNPSALAAIVGKEYIDRFVQNLKMLADSHLQEHLSRPPRARPIHINKALK